VNKTATRTMHFKLQANRSEVVLLVGFHLGVWFVRGFLVLFCGLLFFIFTTIARQAVKNL